MFVRLRKSLTSVQKDVVKREINEIFKQPQSDDEQAEGHYESADEKDSKSERDFALKWY